MAASFKCLRMEVAEAVPCSAKQMHTTFRSSLFSIVVENIAIALIDAVPGEKTAQACAKAC